MRRHPFRAVVAELADAQASGACGSNTVVVRIHSTAPIHGRRVILLGFSSD